MKKRSPVLPPRHLHSQQERQASTASRIGMSEHSRNNLLTKCRTSIQGLQICVCLLVYSSSHCAMVLSKRSLGALCSRRLNDVN